MRIYKEKPKVISEGPVWVCTHERWMYMADTLEILIEVLNKEWEHDKHLA